MIESLISCTAQSAFFLGWTENTIAPFIYGAHFFTLLLATVIGTVLMLRFGRIPLMRALSYALLLLALWIFVDIVLWVETRPASLGLFWTASMLIEPILDIVVFYLFMIFARGGADCSLRQKFLLLILALPALIATPTRLGILGLDATNCQRDVVEGIFPLYTYLLAGALCVSIIVMARKHLATSLGARRTYMLIFSSVSLAFIVLFSGSNLIGSLTGSWDLAQLVFFAMPLLISLLVFTANKYLPEEA